jgi:hypothetical protein
MPIVNVDGQDVPFPDTMSQADIEKVLQDYYSERKQSVSDLRASESQDFANMGAGDVAMSAAKNLPSSVYGVAEDTLSAAMNPIQTAETITQLGAGILQNVLPESVVNAVGKDKRSIKVADQVGKMFVDRYGSLDAVKKTIATDPASIAADVATVLGLKSPSLASKADPLAITAKGAEKVASTAGDITSGVLGTTTGAGGQAVREAYTAGREGGQRQQLFRDNLTGAAPLENVLHDAKQNLQALRMDRRKAYQDKMEQVKSDPTVLTFDGVDSALKDAIGRVTFNGQIKDPSAAKAVSNIAKVIGEWKSLDPARFHTPEGMDALKQRIGAEMDKLPFEARNARQAIGDIYGAVRNDIAKQAPVYDEVMKSYSDSTELIREIERSLSLNDRASADTAMRKLQSTMRSNVNTNFGQRQKLLSEIEGKPNLLTPQLAGQALNEWTPRGIQGATSLLTTGTAYGAGGIPTAIGAATISSPRLVGEAANVTGKAAGAITDAMKEATQRFPYITDPRLRIMLYQAEQAKNQEQQ